MSKLEELRAEYERLAHAMQSGVNFKMGIDPKETTPKHLRVGVNAAMSDQCGLARLLLAKGVFTEEEYFQAMVDAMREEMQRYQAWLEARLGKSVTLV